MNEQGRERAYRIAAILVWLVLGPLALAIAAFGQTASTGKGTGADVHGDEKVEARLATGTFDVTVTPQGTAAGEGDGIPGRMLLEKQFHGALEGTSRGEMLAVRTAVKGSAGYVAIEKVTGSLDGRKGSFVLQHTGTMRRGALQLSVTVVPDSGTDALAGLEGTMTINMAEGKHSYVFDYTIGAP